MIKKIQLTQYITANIFQQVMHQFNWFRFILASLSLLTGYLVCLGVFYRIAYLGYFNVKINMIDSGSHIYIMLGIGMIENMINILLLLWFAYAIYRMIRFCQKASWFIYLLSAVWLLLKAFLIWWIIFFLIDSAYSKGYQDAKEYFNTPEKQRFIMIPDFIDRGKTITLLYIFCGDRNCVGLNKATQKIVSFKKTSYQLDVRIIR